MEREDKNQAEEKWTFEDYAFTLTVVVVVFLLVVPELVYTYLGVAILGGSLDTEYLADDLQAAGWTVQQLRALSPLLFLATTSVCFIKDALDARKTGGYEGSVFTHTFESIMEDAIYMTVTTVIVYATVLGGNMYASWLASPITFVLFLFVFPLVRRDEADPLRVPWLLLFILAGGIVAEVATRAWVAFPLAWMLVCCIELVQAVRRPLVSVDDVFEVLYYAFSVVLMVVGVGFGFWIASWTAFPIAMLICWVLSKFGRFKKGKRE